MVIMPDELQITLPFEMSRPVVAKRAPRARRRVEGADRGPGVDLGDADQRGTIARIYWARFAFRVKRRGLDPEDCLQEVYRGFLTRNEGRRPFDPRASSLSNYGYIVIRSVVINYLDHHRRADTWRGTVGQQSDASTWWVHDEATPDPGARLSTEGGHPAEEMATGGRSVSPRKPTERPRWLPIYLH